METVVWFSTGTILMAASERGRIRGMWRGICIMRKILLKQYQCTDGYVGNGTGIETGEETCDNRDIIWGAVKTAKAIQVLLKLWI